MTITIEGNSAYQQDIAEELQIYASYNGYKIHHFKEVICACGNTLFNLHIDNEECVLIRVCESYGIDYRYLNV